MVGEQQQFLSLISSMTANLNNISCILEQQESSPKGLGTLGVGIDVMAKRGRFTLSKAVDVHDGHHIVQLVVGGEGHGLPHRALGHLSVSQQAVHAVAVSQQCTAVKVG